MICKGCGASYDDSKVLCPYCGHVNENNISKVSLSNFPTTQDEESTPAASPQKKQAAFTLKRFTLIVCVFLFFLLVVRCIFTAVVLKDSSIINRDSTSDTTYFCSDDDLATISDYLDQKNYIRALTYAKALNPDDYQFSAFHSLSQSLVMIEDYYRFVSNIEEIIIEKQSYDDLESYYVDLYSAKNVFDAPAASEQAQSIKQDLCADTELYLKYFYRLTDDEINSLKCISDFYEFKIEGSEEYEDIILERMVQYEQEQSH